MNSFLIAVAFVILYGSGFVAAKVGLQYADPLSFLALRFLLAGIILSFVCLALKKLRLNNLKIIFHCVISGVFLIGLFSVGVFTSIDLGTSPALSSLIISFQPLLVALVCYFLWREPISRAKWCGIGLGFIGVTAIVFNELGKTPLSGLLMSVVGLIGLTVGSLYQKRFCVKVNIFTAGMINSFAAALLCFILLAGHPTMRLEWTTDFLWALLWMSIMVSVCALSLFYVLVKKMPISQVSGLFYLMPVSTLLLSALFFDKSMDRFSVAGIVITAVGMFFINKTKITAPRSGYVA